MNFMQFIAAGSRHAPSDADRRAAKIDKAANATRERWLDALMIDQTRAWMNIGERNPGVIDGLATMLSIAGFAHSHDAGHQDTPDLRVIRGALSAAAQCAESGCVVTADHARAFSSAARRAEAIIRSCTVPAIIYAAERMRETVGLPS